MLSTAYARCGMVTSPHALASQAGLQVLRDGGTAIEAAVAAAAAIAVVYPHMTGLGGDGFWLVQAPGAEPVGIDACGRAAGGADAAFYRAAGAASIPRRGPHAANTVAGTVAGWQEALALSASWATPLPLGRLLRDAIELAEVGSVVTASQAQATTAVRAEMDAVPGFAAAFLPGGRLPVEGEVFRQPALAGLLRRLAAEGLDSFYRGSLAGAIAADLARAGSPVGPADLAGTRAERVRPLGVAVRGARLYNLPPPTQGVASLMILALFDRLDVAEAETFAHVHGLVEATKQAFRLRDCEVGDPAFMTRPAEALLDGNLLDGLARRIDPARALPWPQPPSAGDTVWLGAVDGAGRAASFIQSLYFEFGSGVVLPETGLTWQNRGTSFTLPGPDGAEGWNALRPGRKPFHTLNPALAVLDDGRRMVYGTMGGEGQPQTQAALFTRYARFGQGLQAAITAPRWLLGRTWGEPSVTLKMESRFDPALCDALRQAGHDVEITAPFSSLMGHAGAIVRRPDGVLEGAADPRSDGAALGW